MRLFGSANSWKDIARYYKAVLNNRRPKDLNDKYRLLKLTGRLEIFDKQIERHLNATRELIVQSRNWTMLVLFFMYIETSSTRIDFIFVNKRVLKSR